MKKFLIIVLLLLGVSSCKLNVPESQANPVDKSEFVASEDEIIAHFIDVGQGDANFIELPNGDTMLIDAGISSSGEVIVEYIEDLGYTDIDYVVATHPHADHIGGMAEVIEAFDIGAIYMPKALSTSKTYENLLETIDEKELKIYTARSGVSVLEEDDLEIFMLAPVQETYSNLNNYSIVLKITYGDTSFLYTGDAETESLEEITGDLHADVLKVGHHGSDTSTTKDFLDQVSPSYAIISVGEGNSYGHPSRTTLNLLESIHAKIYRTDLNGTIVVRSDGVNITVDTER